MVSNSFESASEVQQGLPALLLACSSCSAFPTPSKLRHRTSVLPSCQPLIPRALSLDFDVHAPGQWIRPQDLLEKTGERSHAPVAGRD